MLRFIILGAFVALSSAQFQPQPAGRVLEPPIPTLCAQMMLCDNSALDMSSCDVARYIGHLRGIIGVCDRACVSTIPANTYRSMDEANAMAFNAHQFETFYADGNIHERFNGKGYYYSWADPRTSGQEVDWLSGRNFCRQRCMDLVSLETSAENEFIKSRLVQNKVKYIWTSGRLCDFKGCDRPDLQPLHINGWFWTAELQKLAPTNDRSQNDWSESGGIGKPQPDNREAIQGGAPENCLAVLNQFYNDGVNWHDVACHHKKPWVCEENDSLLKYVRFTNPNIRI